MNIFSLKKFAVFIFLILIVFLINFFGGAGALRNFFYNRTAGLQSFLWEQGLAGEKSCNFQESEYLSQIALLNEITEENEMLRGVLDLGMDDSFDLALAEIIAKDPFEDTIVINIGSKKGIEKDMPVITSEKVLVGKTIEVFDDFSRVQLISNTKSMIDIRIQDRDVFAIAKGEGAQKVIIDSLSKEKEVENGDLVVTAALGGIFPSGILVGRLINIEKRDADVFQSGEIEQLFNLRDIEKVLVIKDEKDI